MDLSPNNGLLCPIALYKKQCLTCPLVQSMPCGMDNATPSLYGIDTAAPSSSGMDNCIIPLDHSDGLSYSCNVINYCVPFLVTHPPLYEMDQAHPVSPNVNWDSRDGLS